MSLLRTGFVSVFLATSLLLMGQSDRYARVILDTNNILLGEQVQLVLELNVHASDTVTWPTFTDTLQRKELEIIRINKIDTQYTGNQLENKTLTQKIFITSFDSGYHAVPPIPFKINDEIIETEPFIFEVHTFPIDTTKGIIDIKGPVDVSFTWKDWLAIYWHYILAGLLAVISLFLMLRWLNKRKKTIKEVVLPPPPKIPADILALRQLDELEAKKLWQQARFKDYYSELSLILRTYLENRFGIYAEEMATEEILFHLKKTNITKEVFTTIEWVLKEADLVKFAKAIPIADDCLELLKNGRKIVTLTRETSGTEDKTSDTENKEQ